MSGRIGELRDPVTTSPCETTPAIYVVIFHQLFLCLDVSALGLRRLWFWMWCLWGSHFYLVALVAIYA